MYYFINQKNQTETTESYHLSRLNKTKSIRFEFK